MQSPFAAASWWLSGLAGLFALTGAILIVGGAWLVVLGGSWFYLLAGAGILASATLLADGRLAGAWFYLGTFGFACIWAAREAGLAPWPLLSRLGWPVLLGLALIVALPALRWRAVPQIGWRSGLLLAAAVALTLTALTLGIDVLQAASPSPSHGVAGRWGMPDAKLSAHFEDARPGAEDAAGADWPASAGTKAARRNSTLSAITPQTVARLAHVWGVRIGPPGQGGAGAAPLKLGDSIHHCGAGGVVTTLDAATGRLLWRHDPGVAARENAPPCQGLAVASTGPASKPCGRRLLWGTPDGQLRAIGAGTGAACLDFGEGGSVDLRAGRLTAEVAGNTGQARGPVQVLAAPPMVAEGVVVVGVDAGAGAGGPIRAYDAVTGALRWSWLPGSARPSDPVQSGRSTLSLSAGASADSELGLVYLPLGSPTPAHSGSRRSPAENHHATSLVALDLQTGRLVWRFQTVRHDVWNYGLAAEAALVDLTVRGKVVPALVLASKQGDLHVLDRRTGRPLHGVALRPVPGGGVEPGFLAAVQPMSTFHSLVPAPLVEADMWGLTIFDQLWCRIAFRQADYDGIYTPPTVETAWVQYPGHAGGIGPGGLSVDPARELIVTAYATLPDHNRLTLREEDREYPGAAPRHGIRRNLGWRQALTGLSCKEPPYAGLRAIDLASGATVWDRPLMQPVLQPSAAGDGGSLLTLGGVVFVATRGGGFSAIDAATGATLWRDERLTASARYAVTAPFAFTASGRDHVGLLLSGQEGERIEIWSFPAN